MATLLTGLRPTLAAALCASSALYLTSGPEDPGLMSRLAITALGEARPSSDHTNEAIARFKDWLVQQGADISRIDFKPSQVGQEAGIGVFVDAGQRGAAESLRRRWWAPWRRSSQYAVMAEFPLSTAITATNILNDPQLGQRFGWLASHGALDERQVVQAYLAMEHARGHTSSLAPWLDMLPRTLHSPLMWSQEELAELRGTTLARMAHVRRRKLEDAWRSVLQPVLTELCQQLGAPRAPTLDDLLWADCVYWSRGQSLPVPLRPGLGTQLVAQAAAARGTTSVSHPGTAAALHQLMDVHEGIVPGLDFVNHRSPNQGCFWEVAQSRAHTGSPAAAGLAGHNPASSNSPGGDTSMQGSPSPLSSPASPLSTASVRLQLHGGWRARAGDELTISYGDGKSNEELLMLYGFVRAEGCGEDCVMLAVPVPPAPEWDDLMAARMELLTSSGMRPQFFLKAASITPATPTPPPQPSSSSSSSRTSAAPGPGASHEGSAPVSAEALEALEVFVLEPKEVAVRLEALHAQHRARRQGYSDAVAPPHLSGADLDLAAVARTLKQRGSRAPSPQQLDTLAVQLGLRMAALSTYVRLLEVQLVELEGPQQGTGSLEQDLQLLATHRAAAAAAAASSSSPGTANPPAGVLPYRTWCAVVYRAGQKRVVRAHLVGGRQELQQVMALLVQLQDLQQQQREQEQARQ